jgi:hypothetical protein
MSFGILSPDSLAGNLLNQKSLLAVLLGASGVVFANMVPSGSVLIT